MGRISFKFVPRGSNDNDKKAALVQIMTLRRRTVISIRTLTLTAI